MLVRVQGPNNSAAGGATGNWGWSIKAALDSGADGVIVPQVRTADEVRSVVADCRYPTGPREPHNSLPPDPCRLSRAVSATPGPLSLVVRQKRNG